MMNFLTFPSHRLRLTAALLGLSLAATPALAQNATPEGQLVEGYVACALGGGKVDVTVPMLGLYGWTSETDAEPGLVYFQPAVGEATFAYMTDEVQFCHVESTVLGTEAVTSLLEFTIQASGQVSVTDRVTEEGCSVLMLSNGVTAQITSGGQDPVCASDSDSAVRFFF